ncbi:MAG: tetratricopeptide repeat protein [Flavobacteriales bacterium]
MSKKLYIAIIFCLLMVSGAYAQSKNWEKALKAYQEENFDDAIKFSDNSIMDDAESKDAYTWHVRGFIYRAAHKKLDDSSPASKLRETSIESFLKSIELDSNKEFEIKNKSAVINLAKTYFNDAVRALSAETFEDAIEYYAKYKDVTRRVEPDFSFKQTDIDFNNTLGAVYQNIYENDKGANQNFMQKAIDVYKTTIEIDSLNYNANYNIGVLYYNQGVDLILSIDPEAPLPIVIETQEMCAELFIRSLPYMKRAYNLKPTNRETIIGLAGIYFNLNDNEKSKFFSDLLKEVEDNDSPNR